MAEPDQPVDAPEIGAFLEKPTRDLKEWAWLWEADHPFPVVSHRGGLGGRVRVAFKRLLRPFVRAPQADLWERQRVFNQILITHLLEVRSSAKSLAGDIGTIGEDLQKVQREILADIRQIQSDVNGTVKGLSEDLDDFQRKGMVDVMRHTDALFARLDQKVDRLRRDAHDMAEKELPAGSGSGAAGDDES